MMTTVPALPVTSSVAGDGIGDARFGQTAQACERGIMRVAPFSVVKSSSIQIVFAYPVAGPIGDGAGIDVRWLRFGVVRIGWNVALRLLSL